MVTIPRWHYHAACSDADPEIFFPPGYGEKSVKLALEYCGECPVRQLCLDEALADWQEYGIFGGTTPAQRRRILGYTKYKKRPIERRQAPHGTHGAVMRHRRAKEPNCQACRDFILPIKAEEKRRRKARDRESAMAS